MAECFLDTNILVYAFGKDDPRKREVARTLAESGDAVVSTQVLSELANVLTRRMGFSSSEARNRLSGIAAGCEVIVVAPAIVLDALRVMDRYRYSFYDSQILAAALAAGVKVLFSEDLHGDQMIDGTLTIQSPFKSSVQQKSGSYSVKLKSRLRASTPRAAGTG